VFFPKYLMKGSPCLEYLMNKNKIKLLIKIIFTLIFLWWIFFRVDWPDVWSYLKRIQFYQILLYVTLYFIGNAVSSYKWQFIARSKGIKLPYWKFFQYYYSATFVNNFMPSFVGGDAFKSYEIGSRANKYKESVSSVVFDRITGLWGAMILAVVFSLLNWNEISKNNVLPLIDAGLVFALFLSYLLVKVPSIFNFLPSKIEGFFKRAMKEIIGYNKKSNVITKSILLSFLFNFIGLAGANYVLFRALGIEISMINYLSVVFIISIVSSVPLTINNIGIKEWAYITFFGIFGANATAVITVAILSRTLQMVLSFLAWPIYLHNEKNDPKKSSKIKEFAKEEKLS